jgi:hypothetical protein
MTCPPRPQFRVAQRKAGSVDRFETCCPSSWVFVYADGRVISWVNRAGGISEQVIERRLTPEGVELVRSGILQARDLLGPTNEVPTDAWEDPKARAFVPSRYSVCAWIDDYTQCRVLRFLPAPARGVLRGGTAVFRAGEECTEVTTEEARELLDILGSLVPTGPLGHMSGLRTRRETRCIGTSR